MLENIHSYSIKWQLVTYTEVEKDDLLASLATSTPDPRQTVNIHRDLNKMHTVYHGRYDVENMVLK